MMSDPVPLRRPLFSVVSACYQVASFLPEFIASVDAQTIDEHDLEIVMVDDGSLDATGRMLDEWAARRPGVVRVIHQSNGGQGKARNAGIEAVTGEWVTFPDPDDVLEPDYFANVKAFAARHADCDMLATNRWMLNDATGESTMSHPLRYQFRHEARHNLAIRDRFFHGHVPSAFVRRERLVESGLRFDPRIRPNFEDGHFCAVYLLESTEPQVGFVKSAVYHYRRRADGTSTLQTALSKPGRYTDVLRWGYLDVLQRARAQHGSVPLWLQNFLLYELNYYVGREDSEIRTLAPLEVRDEFHALLSQITAELEAPAIWAYRSTRMKTLTRELLEHAWAGDDWCSPAAVLTDQDPAQGLVQLVYRYVGAEPTEELLLGTRLAVPFAAKTRDVVVQGRVVMHERILWVPARRVRLRVGGRFLPIVEANDDRPDLAINPRALPPVPNPLHPVAPENLLTDPSDRRVLRAATNLRNRRRFADAWVLIDRVHNADDSAEHLFSFLREQRPAINAWFVLEEGTPDFKRMRRTHGRRVVAHGSVEWKALLLNASWVISSHADMAVVDPPALRVFGPTRSRFAFLQHGVIKDDLSGWLNGRDIDLFVTSTVAEYESIVGDHTAYRYTRRETVLTGLPRFDHLFRAAAAFPAEKRDLVLISPTWRDQLVAPLSPGSQRRIAQEGILQTQYMQAWMALITDPALAEAARRHGVTVAVLPHPNMEAALDLVELPAHVKRLSFDDDGDVREVFARAAVLVTDYSSTAFNSAYISRPVVYYQFDAEANGEARHVGLAGYYDYERDGFGPVVHDHEAAVREIAATLDHGRDPRSPWAERMEATFTHRDDKNCERVVARIRAMDRRQRLELAQD